MENNHEVDLIVLGAGLVGLTQAILCAKLGLKVALIEARPPQLEWDEQHYDNRVSAITLSSQKLFEDLDVWAAMQAQRVSPYSCMRVWDGIGFGKIVFNAEEIKAPCLGIIIENRVMLKALWLKAKQYDHIQFYVEQTPKKLTQANDSITLTLESGQTLKAQLIIGSDGARSWLRETLNLETQGWDYHQAALVATVTTELPHQGTAWQRFLTQGPLAFLPLNDIYTSSIVWTSTPENTEAHLSLNDDQFCETLAYAFDYQLGKVNSVQGRQRFPLKMLRAKRIINQRAAIIGDAAHVIHPLGGQGVNLGLMDALCLATILKDAKAMALKQPSFDSVGNEIKTYDLGSHAVLRRYERARKAHVLAMVAAMEFFKQCFAAGSGTIATIRSTGLNWVNNRPWLKKQIIHAAGS